MQEKRFKGPNLETLSRLHDLLPGMIQGIREKRIGVKQALKPGKICRICLSTIRFSADRDLPVINSDVCERCAAMLREGYTALIGGDHFAMVRHPDLQDLAGKIVMVSEAVVKAVKARYGEKSNGDDKKPS